MEAHIIGGAVACAAGVLVAFLNDFLSRAVLKRKPAFFTSFFVVRQLINVAFLAALYFLSDVLPWEKIPMLVGGAIGITVPSFILASRLAGKCGTKDADDMPSSGDSANETESDRNG